MRHSLEGISVVFSLQFGSFAQRYKCKVEMMAMNRVLCRVFNTKFSAVHSGQCVFSVQVPLPCLQYSLVVSFAQRYKCKVGMLNV